MVSAPTPDDPWSMTSAVTSSSTAERLRPLDAESQLWIDRLDPHSPEYEAATEALHALLLNASRFEINRRRGSFPQRDNDHEDLAQQSADDALVAVLSKLGDFRGDSRFTTWAYKFALYEAASKARRRAWQGRELPLTSEGWEVFLPPGRSQHEQTVDSELLDALR